MVVHVLVLYVFVQLVTLVNIVNSVSGQYNIIYIYTFIYFIGIVTQFNYTFLSPLRNIIQFDALTVGITPNDNISWSINNVKVSNTSEHMLLSVLLNDTHQSYRYSLIINETLTTTTLVTFSSTVNNIFNISSITLSGQLPHLLVYCNNNYCSTTKSTN